MVTKRKKTVYLTEEQKMQIMKEYDLSGMAAAATCKKFGISISNLYKIKEVYWPIYQTTKETANKIDQIATLNTVKVHNTRKSLLVETQASEVVSKVLNLMIYKLEIEENRIKGIKTVGEDGKPIKFSEKDIVTVNDLTQFFKVAAPFFMKSVDPGHDSKGMKQTHNFIQNIMNNLTVNNHKNGNTNKDNNAGNSEE